MSHRKKLVLQFQSTFLVAKLNMESEKEKVVLNNWQGDNLHIDSDIDIVDGH